MGLGRCGIMEPRDPRKWSLNDDGISNSLFLGVFWMEIRRLYRLRRSWQLLSSSVHLSGIDTPSARKNNQGNKGHVQVEGAHGRVYTVR